MSLRVSLILPLLLCAPLAWADEAADAAAMSSPWSGSGGELGFASAHGNSTTESFNGRLKLRHSDDDWVHSMDLFGLRSSAQYKQTADDGTVTRKRQTTANRYTASAGSALQLGELCAELEDHCRKGGPARPAELVARFAAALRAALDASAAAGLEGDRS